MVGAGLQGDVCRRAPGGIAALRGISQCHYLGVWAPRLLGVATPDLSAIGREDHAPNAGVGVGQRQGLLSQSEGL